jgi:hypothetical protein
MKASYRICFTAWPTENDCRDVCTESTGKYWIPAYNILETSCKVVLHTRLFFRAFQPVSLLIGFKLATIATFGFHK